MTGLAAASGPRLHPATHDGAMNVHHVPRLAIPEVRGRQEGHGGGIGGVGAGGGGAGNIGGGWNGEDFKAGVSFCRHREHRLEHWVYQYRRSGRNAAPAKDGGGNVSREQMARHGEQA
eukprot:CAMPEP_0119490686 /NCGR_PEP_ID=MMETSP1344-20130328/15790_1 /TAXON_ID=236787 /ORGANISM="Florenciella parvula, Strain CCMP2471" /LENGTH=117 /DNA_ID=CAMNT_0007525877 /DNA_START=96 /DNA_END=446 /DNA_ORIENTATION=+